MLESLVAGLLNRFLGSYIENFDPKQLNIGIWSGDVKLRNLRLKKESLDKFKLPIDVKFGHLGELTLQIPWSNLKSKPVKIIIEDVYLLASPIIIETYDPDEVHRRELALKRDKLQDLELIDKSKPQSIEYDKDDTCQNETFTESLITKIVDNLQITIKNIHIRYEDSNILTEHPYSVGITLDELSAVSTDDSWLPSFISITQAFTHKLLTLKSLSCYWNTDSNSIYNEDLDELLLLFKNSIIEHSNTFENTESQFLLKPVSGNGRITVNKAGTTDKAPHIKSELFFEEFGIELDSDQYRDILWTASKFHWFMKTFKFRKFRPKLTVKEAPLEWFRFAANSILKEIHEKHYKWSWGFFKKRRDDRIAYIQVWKLKMANSQSLSAEDQKVLGVLEDSLSFEDIKFYRSLARNQYHKERIERPNTSSTSNSTDENANEKKGWFSGWWGSENSNSDADDEIKMTEDQRKELYEAIEYDEQKAIVEAIDIPKDRVKIELLATLKKGGACIRQKKNDPTLAEIIFEGCTTQIYQRPDSLLTNFQLQEFRVEDGTNTTLYKHVVSVKPLHSNIHTSENDSKSTAFRTDPFFKVSFEHNPLDGSADSVLLAKLRSMTIFYNPVFIEEVVKFFEPPKVHLDTVGVIMNAAEATVEGLRSQTRLGLQYALEEHKTINTKLDLQAPLIILPLEPNNWKSPVAILDAGHISVISDLADKSDIEKMKAKEDYTADDWKQLNTLMYDMFNLHLQDAQFLIGSSIKSTMEQLHTESSDRPALILDKLNIKLALGISILPEAYNLSKFKIGAEVPRVKLSVNDYQYKIIMQIIDKCIPNLESVESDDSSTFSAFGEGKRIEYGELSDDDGSEHSAHIMSQMVNQAAENQHQFEFNFKVDLVQLSLSRCTDIATLSTEPMVDLIGDNLYLEFYKTNDSMFLDLALTDINMVDRIEKTGIQEFEKLISSNNFNDSEKSEKIQKEIMKLKYSRKQRIVEFNNKEIEVFDQDINLNIAAVKIVVTRKSLLTLLNFTLNTFTDPNPPETPADELKHNNSDDMSTAPQKIDVKLKLESIILVLNDDGIKLATLKLTKADIIVLVMPEELTVNGCLGALTLHDEINQGSARNSMLRKLISIEGDNLAEFTYKTFDRETNTNYYNSLVEFKTASIRLNFVEESFSKLVKFLSQFQKMKYIYDTARDAALNQANNIEDNKLHFNVLLETPIVFFPKLVNHQLGQYDNITMYLGEIYASNEFIKSESDGYLNKIIAGIRNTKLTSEFHFSNGIEQSSEILSDLDLGFEVDYNENYIEGKPTMSIKGELPKVDINLTELQLRYLLGLSESLPKVFDLSDVEDKSLSEIENEAVNANKILQGVDTQGESIEKSEELLDVPVNNIPSDHTKILFKFKVPKLALTIYEGTKNVENFSTKKLSSFTLNDSNMEFIMNEDTHFQSILGVKSFVVIDARVTGKNKFTEIIPTVNNEDNQFYLNASSSGSSETKNLNFMLTIGSPKVFLALDYLFALKAYIDVGLSSDAKIIDPVKEIKPEQENNSSKSNANEQKQISSKDEAKVSPSKIGFSVNIVNPSIILLADPSSEDTQAVVFKVEQLLITSQNIMSLNSNNVGMFLCRMNDFEQNRLRIIDDFSASLAFDSRNSTATNFLTNIQISIEPIIMRVSLRDIRLALTILNNANTLYAQAEKEAGNLDGEREVDETNMFSEEFKKKITQYAPTILSNFSNNDGPKLIEEEISEPAVIIKGEELVADIEGMRLVLIGDVHELPVLDMNIKPFLVKATNWSTDLKANTSIESYVNIFNYSRSSWEPLVEPWPIGVNVSRVSPSNAIMVDVVSRQLAEMTISSRSIALLSNVFSLIYNDEELKPRGEDTPYRILNHTGYDMEVWIDASDETYNKKTLIKNEELISWEFEDWREVRENLNTDNQIGILGLKLLNSNYEEVKGVSVTGEGEDIFVLYPPVDGIHNRLSCQINLGEDKVKTITIRSTINISNESRVPILAGLSSSREENGEYSEVFRIDPSESKAVPIDHSYTDSIAIKPITDTPFEWSQNEIFWKHLLNGGSSLKCPSGLADSNTSFYFQAEAIFDREEPLAKIYPHMNIAISAPLEIENLLPFNLTYRLYDKSSKKDWTNTLEKGESTPVHVVRLEHFLLLSVQPLNCEFGKSEFAIINSPKNSEFTRETRLLTRHENGQKLNIKIHYTDSNNGAGLKVALYSPYVILNRTGQNIFLQERNNIMKSTVTTTLESNAKFKTAAPNMFSFEKDNDRKSRALLKVEDSAWSIPLSLDAIGQSSAVTMQLNGKQAEMNIGVTIKEGEGKYKLSKVITFSPRFILRNALESDIQIMEVGSTKEITVEANEMVPLYSMRRTTEKSLILSFFGSKAHWSSPFIINDIGQIFLKVRDQFSNYTLLKINILIENAIMFIQIEDAQYHWPFSIRNFSDSEFLVYQSNPYVDENGDVVNNQLRYQPIVYRIPAKSVMPYAWDYPAGIIKELVIRSHDRERNINLAEIGNLRPFRLPPKGNEEQAIVDLNVVADGPTQSLVISNYDAGNSLYKIKSQSGSSTSLNQDKFEATENDECHTRVIVKCEGIGLSLITNRMNELCYITLRGLELRYNESDLYQNFSAKLKWIQIDNQLYGGIYPIIFYPSVVPQSGKEMNTHPTFSGAISRVKDDSHGVLYIKYATVLLQEMTLEMDEDFLFALIDFAKIPGASWNQQEQNRLCDDTLELPAPKTLSDSSDIYFEALHLQPTQLNLSFVRTERVNADEIQSSQNTVMFFFNVLTMAIGNINDAPIKLNALFIENIRVPMPILVQSIQTHYGQAFFYQVHKILGSADFLGNPVGLFNNLSSGVLDIFYEPYQGFIMNDRPQELGIGIAKGGLSFLKKSVFGFSDSIAKVTGSLAKGLSVVTLDKQFQERRRLNQRRNKPKDALFGFASGATSFFDGISSGVTGMAMAPVEGANREGTAGFFKGLGKGLIGLPTKTAIGIFDLASNVSEGIRNTTTVFDAEGLDKVRLPRYVSHDAIIRPFNMREAQGQNWLKTIDGGKFFDEQYLAHILLPGEQVALIITFKLMISVQINKLQSIWAISFNEIKGISVEKTGIKIALKKNRQGPFIPIPDRSGRDFLYNRISIAVEEYNKHCRVAL